MTLPFSINGAQAVIPGVYDSFRVAGSLPNPAPAGRSVLIIGEAQDGIPGNMLDLRLNFYQGFNELKAFYTSGPIVDAANMLFSNQPSAEFGGRVERVYVWKTNQTSRASKNITAPANFGSLAAAVFSESGNFIKSQILDTAQALPTYSFMYLPSPAARAFRADVSGTLSASLALGANGTPTTLAADLGGVTGLSTSGGAARVTIAGILTVDASLSASGDVLTISKTGGTGNFGTATQPGDTFVIQEGTAFAGAADANAGSYHVESWTATQIVARQLKHEAAGAEANAAAFDTSAVTGAVAADVETYSPITLTQTGSPVTGAGASLELMGSAGNEFAAGNILNYDSFADNLSTGAAAVGTFSSTVPAAGELQVTLGNANWLITPKAGDVVRIPRGSALAGATNMNVGLHLVLSSTSTSTLLHSCYGLTTEATASANLNGDTGILQRAPGFVSTDAAGLKTNSSAERKVFLQASRVTDGTQVPNTLIGGTIAAEISYNLTSATAATLDIDQNRVLTITPTGAGSVVQVRLLKYKTLQNLADFLNTQAGVNMRIPDARLRSLPTSVLDMVTAMPILGAQPTVPSYNGRLKMDYYSWKNFFVQNFGLLAFKEGTMILKAGLPDAEATAGFLQGAEVGSTADVDVQGGLDKGLNVQVRMVIPLFSRDAQYDVADGNTDPGSSYDIASINAAVQSHVATASSSLNKKERFGMVSFHGSFHDSMQAASNSGYERMQMTFEQVNAAAGDGTGNTWFLPWMGACAIAAGRAQAALGTSMLRKSFQVQGVRHLGNSSLFTDSITPDFNEDDDNMMADAIKAGLLTFRAVTGAGIQLWSPDLSTRSKNNDPEAWVWERVNVLFTCDEVRQTVRSTLENFIGKRQTDTPLSVVQTAANNTIGTFVTGGSLVSGSILTLSRVGNGYQGKAKITPGEAVEFIILDVEAVRAPAAST